MNDAPDTNDAEREIDAFWPTDFLERFGADAPAARAALERNAERFVAALANVDAAALHTRPAPERWSPAEVADHVVLAGGLFAEALERAAADEPRIEMPRGRVGPAGRPRAPRGGEPRAGRGREELERDLRAVHARITAAAGEAEAAAALGRECLLQAFLGPLDGLQVLQLAAWHVGHHRRQLERG